MYLNNEIVSLPHIIAVDFDGTLFENDWPNIGAPIMETILRLKMEIKSGSKIILWTNRTGEQLEAAIKACKEQGIEFDAVNEPLPECVAYFGGDSRKVFANEYWDDRATRQGLSGTTGIRYRIAKDAVKTFGSRSQMSVATGYMSELSAALLKYIRSEESVSLRYIKDKMAGVSIMLDQLRLIFGDCMLQEDKKLIRLKRLLSAEGGANGN